MPPKTVRSKRLDHLKKINFVDARGAKIGNITNSKRILMRSKIKMEFKTV